MSNSSKYIINIEDIERDGNIKVSFKDKITELENCNITADIEFIDIGDCIRAKGKVNGNIILECDRCLNQFPYELNFDIDEVFAKKALLEEYGQELELSSGQFIIDLNGKKEIDFYDLLYQSVILALPNKKVCGINCNEGLFVSDDDIKIHDDRMDIFKNIQIK